MKHEPDSDWRDNPALAWARRTGIADEVFVGVHRQVRGRRRRHLGIAGASLLIVALAAVMVRVPRVSPRDQTAIPATATIAMPAKQTLPDGSTVELKDGASINIEFGAAIRRIALASGEAHFQVTKDSGRPFVVVASGVEIRAVGTAFSVQLGQRAVEVLVTEGLVEVAKAGDQGLGTRDRTTTDAETRRHGDTEIRESDISASPLSASPRLALPFIPLLVDAGKRVTVEVAAQAMLHAAQVIAVTEAEVAQRLSWRVPRLRFSGTPLVEAIPLFNRHSDVQLVIGDPEIGKLKLSGILRADNTDSLVQLLQVEFAITAEPRGELEIVLRR